MQDPITPEREKILHQTFDSCAFHHHLGFQLTVLGIGWTRVDVPYRPELDQGMGLLHGGVYGTLLDTSSYYAALAAYESLERLPMTQEYKINLLGSGKEEAIYALSDVVKAGRRVCVVQTRIYTASEHPLAVGLTSLVLH